MNNIIAIWLVFFRGYSVIRFSEMDRRPGQKEYGACNKPLAYDYCHDGVWGEGDTPFDAVINCHRKVNSTIKNDDMTWYFVKKWLYSKNRVSELCNKGTGREILTLWNGLILLEFSPENWINHMVRSGRPIKLIGKKKFKEAETIYDYPIYEDVIAGYLQPPDKRTNQLNLF